MAPRLAFKDEIMQAVLFSAGKDFFRFKSVQKGGLLLRDGKSMFVPDLVVLEDRLLEDAILGVTILN